jgi:probable F420-dependent oxidoreductase
MKFGVTVPNNWGIENAKEALSFGPLAEELGYDSVWVMDHLFNNGYIRERLDDKPYYHPLATLSYLAATTERVLLGTSVLVLPYHNPVELAKYTATLDHMSDGRVTLGVGVGAMTEEFAALGIPMSERGALTNECIRVMKELWTNQAPSYHSSRWNFDDLRFSPKPVQQPHIPLWIGGASPGALRRAARLGDGWHPSGLTPEEYAVRRQQVRELAERAGRDPDSLTMSARVEVEATGGPSSDRAANRARISGNDLEQAAITIAAYRDAGVEHLVLALNTGEVGRIRSLMEDLASQALPQFR